MEESILILDFGSQYTQLIARRVRELNVYCEIHPYNKYKNALEAMKGIKGIVLSGSPFSVHDKDAPNVNLDELIGGGHVGPPVPLLGICYGAQLMANNWGGNVARSNTREYGRAHLNILKYDNDLLTGLKPNSQVWMSHADTISAIPKDSELIASTDSVEFAAFKINRQNIFGIQFHPEVYHTTEGSKLLHNFVVNICGCKQNWTPDSFIESTVKQLKDKIGNDKVVLGLSGGVDSSVAAVLLHKAIGENLYCIFVDNGLLRKDEFESVLHSYRDMGLNVKGVDAKNMFYDALKGIEDPEKKRKAIGRVFIEVFDQEAHKVKDVKWLAQGTIYPDVIESVSVKGPSMTIKSHHNVGGLPEKMNLKIVEPLNTLFKDEVRRVGKALGVDQNIIGRHPFPGPGLAIRILGDVTPEKVRFIAGCRCCFYRQS